ncbi:hypothetical protein HX800_34020, partial [Pseudomonas gingeri]|nr:hypothetical protein [Pseudomonas gingeri]
TAVNKALKLSKIFGVAALGELNPLSGLGDWVTGAAKLALNTTSAAGPGLKTLKGTASPTELIAAGNRYEAAATGTFKVGERTVEGSAVQLDGKWYAFDAHKGQAYGSPLQVFDPADTLGPSPNAYASLSRGAHRFNPITTISRPPRVRKPLPVGPYAESMKGKLEIDHFKPDTRQATLDKFQAEMKDYYDAVNAGGLPPRPQIPNVPVPLPA